MLKDNLKQYLVLQKNQKNFNKHIVYGRNKNDYEIFELFTFITTF